MEAPPPHLVITPTMEAATRAAYPYPYPCPYPYPYP